MAACCEKSSEEELERVRGACFLLGDAVCWELKRPRWLALEFELLHQAALVAQRPGHFLLIRTLERACRGMAGRVEPYLDSAALYRWTQCAMEALCSKDVKVLRSRLPALLQTSDERVLQALAPSCEAHGMASRSWAHRDSSPLPEASLTSVQVPELGQPAPEPIQVGGGPGALCTKWSGHHTTLREVLPGGAPSAAAPTGPGSEQAEPSLCSTSSSRGTGVGVC